MNELPSRGPNDPPIQGPHVVLHDDGTRQMVFAGPNTWPRTAAEPAPTPRRPLLIRSLYDLIGTTAGLAALTSAGLFALEYPQLTVPSRLACGTITVLVSGWFAIRHARCRKVRS